MIVRITLNELRAFMRITSVVIRLCGARACARDLRAKNRTTHKNEFIPNFFH